MWEKEKKKKEKGKKDYYRFLNKRSSDCSFDKRWKMRGVDYREKEKEKGNFFLKKKFKFPLLTKSTFPCFI